MLSEDLGNSLFRQVCLFFQAFGFDTTQENSLFVLAKNLEASLGLNQLLYELPGDAQELAIDLSCYLDGTDSLTPHLPLIHRLDLPSSWLQVLVTCGEEKSRCPERWLNWRGLWLEFDSSVSSRTRPNLFVTLTNKNKGNLAAFILMLDLIRDRIGIHPVIDQNIRQLHGALPSGVSVVQSGFLLPRSGGQRVKICLLGMTPSGFASLQQKMHFVISKELLAVWQRMIDARSNWVCALDFYPDGGISPAFEIQAAEYGQSGDRDWQRILDHLPSPRGVLASLAMSRKRVQSCLSAQEWPLLLEKKWRETPSLVESVLVTALNHVKIAVRQDNSFQVKYYFLQQPLFKTQRGAYVPVAS